LLTEFCVGWYFQVSAVSSAGFGLLEVFFLIVSIHLGNFVQHKDLSYRILI
jgi:hypothetical protein